MAKPKSLEGRDDNEEYIIPWYARVGMVKQLRTLIEDYDPLLSTNKTITKLVEQAIKDHYLPGYERKFNNGLDKRPKKGYKESSEPIKEVN